MKQKMIVLMSAVLFCHCVGNKTPNIDGTYVNHSEGEYSIASDTLVVKSLGGNSYSIIRKTGFQKIRDGKLSPQEKRQEDLTAVYDSETGQLRESKRGRKITLDEASGILRLEATEYEKLP